jgi:hypothetical protein
MEREEVVTLGVAVADGSAFPFLLGLAKLLVSAEGILVAGEMYHVRVRHCRDALCSIEAASVIRYLVDLHLLRVDVHAEDISGLLGVAFLAYHALRAGLFDLLVYLFEEGTLLLLTLHLGQDLLPLKQSQLFLLIVLLVD